MTSAPSGDGPTSFRQPTVSSAGAPSAVLRVLVIEGGSRDSEQLGESLSGTEPDGLVFSWRRVPTLAAAGATLTDWPADAVVLDLSAPYSHGFDALQALRAQMPDIPVVVMTGMDDDAIALRAMQAGAQSHLVRGRSDDAEVRRAVRYAVERQRLVVAARGAARMRDEVLAVVAHDLRSPLSAIRMSAEALLDPEMTSLDKARELGDIIRRSSVWMDRLIRDLLDMSRVDAGALTLQARALSPRMLVRVLVRMFAPVADRKGVSLSTVVEPDLPRVSIDPDRMVQALGNIIDNALKFTPAGGRVTITAERAGERRAGDGGVRLRVSDTGCGIAPENLAHVFDRFWQVRETHRAGAGLGLTIAKGIIEAHGGTIEAESTVAGGTTFTCTIPAAGSTDTV